MTFTADAFIHQVHILDASCLTQAEFLVPFMLTTDGQGFEIIISDLPEEQFLASWNFVARGGFLVNLNESLPAQSVPLPMNGFLKNVSVFSLSKRSISSLPPHRKQRLHGLVDEFLRSGKVIMIPHRPLSEDVALSQRWVIINFVQHWKESITLSTFFLFTYLFFFIYLDVSYSPRLVSK